MPPADRRLLRTPGSVLLLALLAATVSPAIAQEQVLVDEGSPMAYLVNAADPGLGLGWVDSAFDDSEWTPGTYGVGYEVFPPARPA